VTDRRRRAITTPGEQGDPARRGPASVAISAAVHVVAIAILIRIAIVPINWALFSPHAAKPAETHVDYVQTSRDTSSRAKPRAGGDNQRITSNVAPVPIVAPSIVPSTLPPVPPKTEEPPPAPSGGTGPLIGGGGPTRGIVPSFADPRIWEPSSPAPVAPKTQTERLDSAIATRIHHLEDSLAALGVERAPGDWTWGKDGKKYGIDQKYIHLGNFSIPTALLALLPLNVQGNPTTYADAKHMNLVRGEILEQAARSARDADFNQAVKELRERKQKERAEKEKADATLPEAPPPPHIIP
jgi:hypothetical protein